MKPDAPGTQLRHETLKARQRELREVEPLRSNQGLQLRVHRALSWYEAAESAPDDDSRFIFLWIAFNAFYATAIDDSRRLSEQSAFIEFLRRLLRLDVAAHIEAMVWVEFSDSIRNLLANRYLSAGFWRVQAGQLTNASWQRSFDAENRNARSALSARRTARVLAIVLSRVYVLRNQIVHGGATWQSQVNREQMRLGVRFLGKLVPTVIAILLAHPHEQWPAPTYPVVDEPPIRVSPRPRRSAAPPALANERVRRAAPRPRRAGRRSGSDTAAPDAPKPGA